MFYDGPPCLLWWGEFKKENRFAKKIAEKATHLVK